MIIVYAAYKPFSIGKVACCLKFDINKINRAISIVSALSAYLVVGHLSGNPTAYALNAATENQGFGVELDDNIITGDINKRKAQSRIYKRRRLIRKKPPVKYDKWGFKIKPKRGKSGARSKARPQNKQSNIINWFTNHTPPEKKTYAGGNYRTMCVRLRDGYYWPISFKAKYSDLKRDAERCTKSCMNPARLFYGVSPGETIGTMRDLKGKPYKSLKNAFRYRKEYVKDAICKPQPWTLAAKERHRYFASPASFASEIRYFAAPKFAGEKQLMATRINIRKLRPAQETTWVNKLRPARDSQAEAETVDIATVKRPPAGALMYERKKFAVLERAPVIHQVQRTKPPVMVEMEVAETKMDNAIEPMNGQVAIKNVQAPVQYKRQPHRTSAPNKPKAHKLWFADLRFNSNGKVFARTQYHYMRRRKKMSQTSTRPWELQAAGRRIDS